jgi:hypothetical protein
MLVPSLAVSHISPHFLGQWWLAPYSTLPRAGPIYFQVKEHVTYLPPVMSTISRG